MVTVSIRALEVTLRFTGLSVMVSNYVKNNHERLFLNMLVNMLEKGFYKHAACNILKNLWELCVTHSELALLTYLPNNHVGFYFIKLLTMIHLPIPCHSLFSMKCA